MRVETWQRAVSVIDEVIARDIILAEAMAVASHSNRSLSRKLIAGKIDITDSDLDKIQEVLSLFGGNTPLEGLRTRKKLDDGIKTYKGRLFDRS